MEKIPKRIAQIGQEEMNLVKVLIKTVKHFFPDFPKWIKLIPDKRKQDKIDFRVDELLWVAIFMFVFNIESRRNIKFKLNNHIFAKNITVLLRKKIKQEKIPHGDTLNYFFKQTNVKYFEFIKTEMIRTLIRKKCLENYRLLNKYYMIAVDGTGVLVFNERHCNHCLERRTNDGKIIYYSHPVLEAKLVTENGFVFSIGTEFIENTDGKAKQDCELKAFYRLAEKIKTNFPQMNICILADALYAAMPVFKICNKNNWKYIITFKDGSIVTVAEEIESLEKLHAENRKLSFTANKTVKNILWISEINYNEYFLNYLKNIEIDKKNGKSKKFAWVTNLTITEKNYMEIEQGGRLRWKIENGFNMQKNGGYKLEHAYSKHPEALKIFYIILQIAHTINQLMERGNLLPDIRKAFGSIKNFTKKLLEAFTCVILDPEEIKSFLNIRRQIRFNSS